MILLKELPAHLTTAARWMPLEFQVNIRLNHFLWERNCGISDSPTDRAPSNFHLLRASGTFFIRIVRIVITLASLNEKERRR